MKTVIKISIPSFLIALALACTVGLLPKAQAVSPAPDGGYPGGNTAEGQSALFSLTTGGYNTAVGFLSLRSNTTGQLNTAIGAGTLLANTADENTATGAAALLSNATGGMNTANGAFALFSNTTGIENTATGDDALVFNTTGVHNTADGALALFTNTGSDNTAQGYAALNANADGIQNTATGAEALGANSSGNFNTALGFQALSNNSTGGTNTAIGYGALSSNTTGSSNIALGWNAGGGQTTGSNNIFIGDLVSPGLSNLISIGANPASGTPYENTYIGGIYDAAVTQRVVYIDSDGHLGTLVSSARYKEEIRPMDKASEAIFALKPVTFRYKQKIDPSQALSFGLIAEDVASVSDELVSCDKEGNPKTVRYDAVNAMLLNEFLKEHKAFLQEQRKVQKLEATVSQQQKGMESLTTQLKEQAAQIQKVSAQIEARPRLQGVVSNR
jgi:trimeric autotransporter adhesin